MLSWWRSPGTLKDFHQELARGRLVRRYQRGLCVVPVERVVGSVSKAASMTRRFRYKSGAVDERLRRLRRADQWGQAVLPPVELYQLNDDYYVVDGHHRLAIAIENRQADVDANVVVHVVEYPPEPSQAEANTSAQLIGAEGALR